MTNSVLEFELQCKVIEQVTRELDYIRSDAWASCLISEDHFSLLTLGIILVDL